MLDITFDINIILPIYRPYLQDFKKRYEIHVGSANSGKSYFVAQKLLFKALSCKNEKILVLRKIDKTVENSVFAELIRLLSSWGLYNYCKIHKTTKTITLPNGSMFICCGLSDPERIKSIVGITRIWLEESTEFNYEDFQQLDLRLRNPDCPDSNIILSLNPVSRANWVYKRFYSTDFKSDEEMEGALKLRKQCRFIHSTYKDNPYVPQSWKDGIEAVKHIDPRWYSIYANGEWGTLDKLVYNNWRREDFDIEEIKRLGGILCIGVDWGFSADETAIISSIVDEPNKRLYVFDEFYETGHTNPEIADILKAKGYAKSTVIFDSSEPKSIEEIRRMGIRRATPAIKGQGSILSGIKRVSQYEILVHPSCENILLEFESYSWQKDKQSGEYVEKPIDKYNHALDALRYSLQCLDVNVKLKSMPKQLLGL